MMSLCASRRLIAFDSMPQNHVTGPSQRHCDWSSSRAAHVLCLGISQAQQAELRHSIPLEGKCLAALASNHGLNELPLIQASQCIDTLDTQTHMDKSMAWRPALTTCQYDHLSIPYAEDHPHFHKQTTAELPL